MVKTSTNQYRLFVKTNQKLGNMCNDEARANNMSLEAFLERLIKMGYEVYKDDEGFKYPGQKT